MIKQFYEKTLPTQGVYCVSGITKAGHITTRFAETFDSFLNLIELFKSRGENVFVTPGTYGGFSRMGDNCVYVRSFFVDLDVGPKGYPTQQDALEAFNTFVAKVELPPAVRLNSGRGIHAYWIFDEDIPAAEWRPYAEKFKARCIAEGLIIDPTVTADAARLMRCPDTFNYRTDPPSPTSLIDSEFSEYSFDMFKEFLDTGLPAEVDLTEVQKLLSTISKGLDPDTAALKKYDNFESMFQIIAEKSLLGEGCAQIEYALLNSKTLGYDPWIAALQTAARCDDADEAIHLLSEDYPGYDRNKVRKKAATFTSPRTCTRYEADAPERCAGCMHKGRISTPKELGRRLKTAEPETQAVAVQVEESIRKETHPQDVPEYPAFLYPFVRGVNGGIYYTPPARKIKGTKGEKEKVLQDDPILIINNDLYPTKRMYSPLDGDCLMMKNVLPMDAHRDFLLPMSTAYTPDLMTKTLTANGVYFQTDSTKHVKDYIVKWGQYLQQTQAAEQMRMQFGWTEDLQGFVVGNSEIRKSGETVKTASSPFIQSIAKLLTPKGDYDLWKEAIGKLNTPSLELHAFVMLCGFGSPLMRLTTTNGAVFSLTGKSGVAKTGAMYAALSVVGNPEELSIFKATDAGLANRALGMHSMLLGVDEVTNMNPLEVSKFIHQMASGKGKIRLQSSVNAERPLELSSKLITIMTTNESLYDKLSIAKASPDGEVARLIEFVIERPKAFSENSKLGPAIFETVANNYGHAIYEFIKRVFELGDVEVKRRIDVWIARFIKAYGSHEANRFYENSTGATFAAGEIIVEMGMVKLDLDRIFDYTVNAMINIRDNTIKVNEVDYNALLGDFYNKSHSGMLVLDGSKVTTEPRMALVARVEVENSVCYVSKPDLKAYLAELKISVGDFERGMKDHGLVTWPDGKKYGKKRLAAGWKAGMGTESTNVYAFTISPEEFLKEINAV